MSIWKQNWQLLVVLCRWLLYTGCLLNDFSWGGGGDFRWLLTAGGRYENSILMIYSCTNKRFGLIFQFVYTFLVLDSFTVEN